MEIERALKEFKRVLKTNGKIVISDICAGKTEKSTWEINFTRYANYNKSIR